MNSLKKPLNMDVQKVDSARALVAGVMHWAVTTGGFNSETAIGRHAEERWNAASATSRRLQWSG